MGELWLSQKGVEIFFFSEKKEIISSQSFFLIFIRSRVEKVDFRVTLFVSHYIDSPCATILQNCRTKTKKKQNNKRKT